MKKIETITAKQKALIPRYVDKWVSYASNPVDFMAAKEAIGKLYELSGKKRQEVLIARGPLDAFYTAVAVGIVCGEKQKIKDTLYNTLENTLRNTLGNTLGNTLVNTLRNTLVNTLVNTKDEKIKEAMKTAYDSLYVTQYWAFWAGYYDYAEMIGVQFDKEKKDIFLNFCKEVPIIYCFQNLAIICEKPEISWKELPAIDGEPKNRILHNEKGAAIKYKDGFEIYCLNNIVVPKWLVGTEAGQIDAAKALTEKNVDVQREIIRKVGAERMLKSCNAKTLDIFMDKHTKGGNEYKLMEMEIGNNIKRKYLYFEHASFPGVWYAQPVDPALNRALHARAWILGIGETEDLSNQSDENIMACLPVEVA